MKKIKQNKSEIFSHISLFNKFNFYREYNKKYNQSFNNLQKLYQINNIIQYKILKNKAFKRKNYFNPQSKKNLKNNLILYLIENKPIEDKIYYKDYIPKKLTNKFFQNYQKEILNKKEEKLKEFINYSQNYINFNNIKNFINKENQTKINSYKKNKSFINNNYTNKNPKNNKSFILPII